MPRAGFRCACGNISGTVDLVPRNGLHLECFCDSCRAGALHCGATLGTDAPVGLYLTPPHNVKITQGTAQLVPFSFSPRGILRWKAGCCGVQMFSSQRNPTIAFMSVRSDRLTTPEATGPVLTKTFMPGKKGLRRHLGKRHLSRLILKAATARMVGLWRKTPLYDPKTRTPIAPVTLVTREEKAALLGR